ncbi:MAG: hypothetical protein ABSF26_27385 [Thermoguttaceae bacterium]
MKKVLSALVGALLLGPAPWARGDQTTAGPENAGLRLRLSIETMNENAAAGWKVHLDLLNVGKTPVVLVGDWPYEENTGDYTAFLRSAVSFLTYPEVEPESAQTAGQCRKSPQPEQEIKPGTALVVEWQTKGRCLKSNSSEAVNTTPYFPTAGLYGVRARIVVVTKEKHRVLLTSNEQQVAVGGSLRMPKYATGRIVTADPEKKTISIDRGTDHKIAKGDVFTIRWGLQASWRFRVTEVGTWFAKGPVETVRRDERPDVPRFPEVNWAATLVCPLKSGPSAP